MPPKKKKPTKQMAAGVPEQYRKAPNNMTYVYNRHSKPFPITFAAQEEVWEGHEYRLVDLHLAGHSSRKGIYKWDPSNKRSVVALVDMRHKLYGVPMTPDEEKKGDEKIIRSAGANTPTQVETIEVPD